VLVDNRKGTADLEADLKDWVRERLAKYEYPRAIEFVADLPKTETGKVRRASLRRRENIGTEAD
jgi:acetyl-CoA synthetase